jgi:hypothetical protein
MSGRCINKTADSVAKVAFNLIFNNTMVKLGKLAMKIYWGMSAYYSR